MKKRILYLFMLSCFSLNVLAQEGFVHKQSNSYEYPTDPKVMSKLNEWKDLKFGVLFHWGLYAIPGIVESWSICSEDVDWIRRDSSKSYSDYKRWYWELKDVFNPIDFNPDNWAQIMEQAGMKYMIFTTKHHDGFNLFDTHQTDFSVMHSAFKNNPKANIAKHVFEAFRKKQFMIGAYFSKPDWNCPYYWWPKFATPTRNVNYKIEKHPDRWAKFQNFTFNQIQELMSDYGEVDILWLDGGWVTAPRQNINMDKIANMARKNQPGLLIVDRTIHGKYENYQTPERSIPQKQLKYPWESCITLSNDWGWVPNAPYKSSRKVIATLAEIVAKGGCLALGVGPTAKGTIEQPIIDRLTAIGKWLKVNGEGIYNTTITENYQQEKIWFTANKNKKNRYAIYTLLDNEHLPKKIEWEGNIPKKGSKITLLQTTKNVHWQLNNKTVIITLPKHLKEESLVFKIQTK